MAKTTPTLKAPGIGGLPPGQNVTLYEKGTAFYGKARVGGPVTVHLDSDVKLEGIVNGIQVGPLIELLIGTGSQAIAGMPGRIAVYSPLGAVQALTDAQDGAVLDVTELYVAVTVAIAMP